MLCSFLDRTNVGNAKVYNLEADLGMTNSQYNQGLAAFYPLYIASWVGPVSMMVIFYVLARDTES